MVINLFLYVIVQPIAYAIILIMIFKKIKYKIDNINKIERFIFFVSILPFITLIILILNGNGDLFLYLIYSIPKSIRQEGLIKSILGYYTYASWLLCASVIPLYILFNKFSINIKIGLIIYSINFIFYFALMVAMIYGYITFP